MRLSAGSCKLYHLRPETKPAHIIYEESAISRFCLWAHTHKKAGHPISQSWLFSLHWELKFKGVTRSTVYGHISFLYHFPLNTHERQVVIERVLGVSSVIWWQRKPTYKRKLYRSPISSIILVWANQPRHFSMPNVRRESYNSLIGLRYEPTQGRSWAPPPEYSAFTSAPC